MTIEFNTTNYRWTYGHDPKGYGVWAFKFEGYEVFAPASTYAQAKKWCKAKIKELAPEGYTGFVYVEVLT